MLVLKLLLTPLLIGLVSLAGRRWGVAVSGWLVGLPLTSAPVTLFLALEQGPAFAAQVAQGTLLGLISQALFCLAYAWLAFRVNWVGCWLSGWGLFFAATLVFEQITAPFPLIFAAVIASLALVLFFMPQTRGLAAASSSPRWEIAGRMVLATGLVLALTSAASILGPHLSGLLSPLPVFATVFAIFTHRFQGARAARQILRGVIVSSFACAVFFLAVIVLIERQGIAAAFGAATLSALLTQGTMLWLLKRFSFTPAPPGESNPRSLHRPGPACRRDRA
jgi:hypothetical protein